MKFLTFISLFFAMLVSTNTAADDKDLKAVLVTGSNSGLGLRMTQLLSENGFFVYAGVLHEDDMAAMNKMDNVQAIQFDVTNQDEIDQAVKFVTEQDRGLYGLINNAGVGVFGPMTEVPVSQIEYQMDVNVFGPYRVTQAFAPMIMASKGRIATTGSIAGILAGEMFGPYAMSKHAIEAFNDSLAKEMARFGVSVHVIEPGNYASQIGNTAKQRIESTNYWPVDTKFKENRAGMLAGLGRVTDGPDPLAVAEAALDIMQSQTPKARYMVTHTEAQADATVRRQISKMLELNIGQPHSFDREKLIKMLDEELAKFK